MVAHDDGLEDGYRVAVLGPGGVGGLLAGLLARSGNRVVCVGSEDTVAHLALEGLQIHSRAFGNFKVPVDAVPSLDRDVDACLVTVKSSHLETALDRLPAHTLAGAIIVPFLNGVEHVEVLRRRYPRDAVVPGTIRVESTRVAPGVIEHASPFAVVELALAARPAAVGALGHRMTAAGLEVNLRDDEAAMLWDKLAFLAPLALLTTHAQTAAGPVRTDGRAQLLHVVSEVVAVARAEGATAGEDTIVGLFDSIPSTMESSMQRDAAAGRTVELEAIGGAVLRAADRQRIKVPTLSAIVEDLQRRVKEQV